MTNCETVVPFALGDNTPIYFIPRDANGDTMDLAGSEFLLTVDWPGGLTSKLVKDSTVDSNFVVEIDASTELIDGTVIVGDRVAWNRTLEESRLIPLGNLTRWELERRIDGQQENWGNGRFNGYGGLTDD